MVKTESGFCRAVIGLYLRQTETKLRRLVRPRVQMAGGFAGSRRIRSIHYFLCLIQVNEAFPGTITGRRQPSSAPIGLVARCVYGFVCKRCDRVWV